MQDKLATNPSLKEEIKNVAKLALPICMGQLAGLSISFVDTVMSGRAGAIHMAAVAVATSIWAPITLFGQGLLVMITPFVSQKMAAATIGSEAKKEGSAHYLRQGIFLSLAISLLTVLAVLIFSELVRSFDFDKELTDLSSAYLRIMSIGVIPLFFYATLRYYLEGLGLTVPTMVAGFLALAINIPLNYIFIFGKFGMPALGAVGCAVASVVVCFVMALAMLYFVKKASPHALKYETPHMATIKKILFVSFPSAIATLFEVSLFALVALFIAPFGREIVAGHQVASNAGSMTFMLPLSLAIAVSIRLGSAYGAKSLEQLKNVRKASYFIAMCIGLFNASLFFFLREPITLLYSNEPQVIEYAVAFLIYAAVFQFVDAIQITSIGLLRGYNDTKAIFVLSLISYWLIAFPVGYMLTFYGLFGIEAMGPFGFWVGFVVGLVVGSILFSLRVLYLERQPEEKLYRKLVNE